jgi:serine/threonine protein kinase/tetratricopeptide (TPR) repeat protein
MPMSPPLNNPPQNEEAIFQAAVELPGPDRPAYLDAACGENRELRARLNSLLASHEQGGFMQEMPAALSPEIQAELARLKSEEPGEQIGHYQLLELLGKGGFGTVWVARQEQPVQREVALKLLKAGMDSEEVLARFEQERQALAVMDHPNIAKVFDAGATPSGRPYFVMELVRGKTLTTYCDEARLSTVERLRLFIAVCQAVQHAHQKGIIHRDLKPSNILVTLQDGVAIPKVIDFGVAKVIQGRLTDKTLATRLEQLIGTPAYMSPEQAEMDGRDVDTRSDIYSLGVLLYELLTGRTPFTHEDMLKAGYQEIRRMICETEPKKPSTALETMGAEVRSTVAKHRQCEPPRLVQLVRGDLDWIVMKALEKDRARRYETANALALDIQRFLDDEPVSAGPPSARYRFAKFARRHKAALRVAALIVVILVAATVVSIQQAVRAGIAEKKANAKALDEKNAREDAEAVSAFIIAVLQSPDPSRDGRSITVAELLDRAAGSLEPELAKRPERQAQFQYILGNSYLNLRLDGPAIPLLEQARDFYLANYGPEHPYTLNAQHGLATAYFAIGRTAEALQLQEKVLALRRKIDGAEALVTLKAIANLATYYYETERRPEALVLREQSLALFRRVCGPEAPDTLSAMANLAVSYLDASRPEEAMKMQEEVLKLRRQVSGPRAPDTLSAMTNLAMTYFYAGINGGHMEDAPKLLEEAVPLSREIKGPDHPDTLNAMLHLATCYARARRHPDALKLREEVLEIRRRTRGPKHANTLEAAEAVARSLAEAGRVKEAIEREEEVLRLQTEIGGPDALNTLTAMYCLAKFYFLDDRRTESLELWEKVFELNKAKNGLRHRDTILTMRNLAKSYYAAARIEEGLKLEEKVVEAIGDVRGAEDPETLGAMTDLAISYRQAGKLADAIALQTKTLEAKKRVLPAGHQWTINAMLNLAACYAADGRAAEAEALRKEAEALKTAAPPAKSKGQ